MLSPGSELPEKRPIGRFFGCSPSEDAPLKGAPSELPRWGQNVYFAKKFVPIPMATEGPPRMMSASTSRPIEKCDSFV